MKAVCVSTPGGPEVMEFKDIPDPIMTDSQVLIDVKVSGVNFIDVYFRTGLYKTPIPMILGLEGAGIIAAFGKTVEGFKIGDRVAYTGILGSYAQRQTVAADRLVILPPKISFQEGATCMIQGMTAHYLTKSTYPLKKGDTCLIHAAAGGVGLLLCQVGKILGATVIGTVSTDEKAALAKEAGADHVINYSKQDFVSEVKRITGNRGVNVVYDGVGKATFEKGLDCLMPRGMMVLFGQASGSVSPIDPVVLNQKGSIYLTRPGIMAYISTREELEGRANDVFTWVMKGKMKLRISREFPLSQAREAHMALEGRKTTGKILLIP